VITSSRDANGFTGIDDEITGKLKFTPDRIYKIGISGQRNIVGLITLPVIDRTLRIRFKNNARPVSYHPIEIRSVRRLSSA
jgi:hypothetical protein